MKPGVLRVRFWFEKLPREELRLYRHLRRRCGMDREMANVVMWGRYTVHGHGHVRINVVTDA